MAKSLRSKREKRLRAIRREIVEPYYDEKDAAKLAALEAALSAPKLPVKQKTSPFAAAPSFSAMEITNPPVTASNNTNNDMDVEMDDNNHTKNSLKPIGKKLKKKLRLAKRNRRGKGKTKRRHI